MCAQNEEKDKECRKERIGKVIKAIGRDGRNKMRGMEGEKKRVGREKGKGGKEGRNQMKAMEGRIGGDEVEKRGKERGGK